VLDPLDVVPPVLDPLDVVPPVLDPPDVVPELDPGPPEDVPELEPPVLEAPLDGSPLLGVSPLVPRSPASPDDGANAASLPHATIAAVVTTTPSHWRIRRILECDRKKAIHDSVRTTMSETRQRP
jgi:hypothetical protein